MADPPPPVVIPERSAGERLGLAAALLRPRRLLVLDEPTNGLDPQGMREIRSLVRELAAEGTTVFLSSHLLDEIEQVCTHAGGDGPGPAAGPGPGRRTRRERPRPAHRHHPRPDEETIADLVAHVLRALGAPGY
ncbi:hypothetical protein SMICM17S_02383 [Streptomyces microflavus]